MSKMTLTIDRKSGEVSGHTEEGRPLEAGDLESIIEILSHARENMPPPVPQTAPLNVSMPFVTFPPWWIQPDFHAGSVVLFRHPGMGWTGFSINPQDALKLASYLMEQNNPAQHQAPSGQQLN